MLRNALSLHSLPERNKLDGRDKGSEKKLKKVSKSFGDSRKSLTFASALSEKQDSKRKRKVLKNNSKKSLKKIWKFEKDDLSLHHFPLEKSGQGKGREVFRTGTEKKECSYRNIENGVL